MDAIIQHESGGNCNARGKSGEIGCMQFMPSTWRHFSNIVYGEVRDYHPSRERYIATVIIQSWLKEGLTAGEVALRWNQGHEGQCKAGVNSKGVAYDSCAYKQKILALLNS